MKKMIFRRFGPPDVLEVIDAPMPSPEPGQVRIRVVAAGVNPVDWRLREGQVLGAHPLTLPSGVGIDAAGVVEEVGARVSGVRPGDRVFGEGLDTYAEQAVLTAWHRMPDSLTFAEAAGYPSVVETAIRVINQVGAVRGETLVVSGAAGGVGSAVLQIAQDRGITVVGTASAANLDYLRSLGAQATTYDHGWDERARALGPVNAGLDLAGAGVVEQLVALTGDPDRVVSIADLDAPTHGVRFSGTAGSVRDALVEAARLIEAGRLHIPVVKRYTLEQAPSAHRDSRDGHARGRRVIVLADESP